jgi:hypothetical protein
LNAAVAQLRFASWRWMSAIALAAALLVAALPLLSPGPEATAPSSIQLTQPAALTEPDPLTPAVAEIAWRDPRERIEVIAQFKPGVEPTVAADLVRTNGGRVIAEIGLINGLAAEMSAGDAAELARQPGLRAVSLNARIEGSSRLTPNGSDLDVRPRELATSFNQSVRSPEVWYGGRNQATG